MINDRVRLRHIVESIDRAFEFTKDGRDNFFSDAKTQHAVVRALEVIGEAVKGITSALQDANPDVPWRQIASMRDRLIHGYFIVDLKVVWSVVEKELMPLRQNVHLLLQHLPPDEDE